MNTLQTVLVVIGALFSLSAIAGALYAYTKSSAQEARITRLQGERDDYLSRINYIEPRWKSVEEQNKMLRTLMDPTPKLQELGETLEDTAREVKDALERQARTTDAIKGVLLNQARTLDEIRDKIHEVKP